MVAWSGSTLAYVVACCLTAQSHYRPSSAKSSDIHIRAISQRMPQPSISKICLKITCLKFRSNFPGANELNTESRHHKAVINIASTDTNICRYHMYISTKTKVLNISFLRFLITYGTWHRWPSVSYSISQEICTRFLLCCAFLWLYIDWFSHIHQAYFTGTVAI